MGDGIEYITWTEVQKENGNSKKNVVNISYSGLNELKNKSKSKNIIQSSGNFQKKNRIKTFVKCLCGGEQCRFTQFYATFSNLKIIPLISSLQTKVIWLLVVKLEKNFWRENWKMVWVQKVFELMKSKKSWLIIT